MIIECLLVEKRPDVESEETGSMTELIEFK